MDAAQRPAAPVFHQLMPAQSASMLVWPRCARVSVHSCLKQHALHAGQVHPKGEVGQALDALQPGDKVAIKGPFGKYVYKPGKFKAIGAAPHRGGLCSST